ncbi:Ribonuclease 3 [Eumeta japonica]|uniref:Ribonuclease 3 n=1 Tax=Eumeta variegata TaxID=151549 RepID=A0A4C1T4I4_EUMVA|nr:Ribonuclease 3 [Eumeta japonica]
MEQWSREQDCDNEKSSKMWYRSSPAELYYTPVEGNRNMQQTQKLTRLCETFFVKLIERGRKARPEIDELPPLKPQKPKLCKHKFGNDKLSSSSSSDSEESLDEDGLQGYADRVMMELQRKQNHPRRLHPEMWFNNPGEMNGGPLCRCSARARRHGMRHGVYAGEETFPRCILTQNNIDRLYHYRMKASEQMNTASTLAAGPTEAMQLDDEIASISKLDCIDIEYVRTPIIKNTFSSS